MCPEHGGPLTECSDPDKLWYPQRHICRATMELAAADRRYKALHEKLPFHDGTFESWAKEASASHPYNFMDGVRLYVAETDVNPSDDFLSPQRATDPEGGD